MKQGRKRQRMIKSSVQLEDLQDDLFIEILCGVPYKDLMRCKCVSKRWLSLISNPGFVARHRFVSINKLKLKLRSWTFIYRSRDHKKLRLTSNDSVFRSDGFSLSFLPCYRPQQPVPIHILHTFNDLVLCCENGGYFHRAYYVCNPLTMQWVALPPTPRYYYVVARISVNLICESSEEEAAAAAMCRFKVVRVYKPNPIIHVDIFSSSSEQWVTIDVELPNYLFSLWEIVTCNGTLFAIAYNGQIMALNLNSLIKQGSCNPPFTPRHHHYQLLHLPKVNDVLGHLNCQKLTMPMAYQGRLRVVRIGFDIVNVVPVLYIWELKEDYHNVDEYWSLVHRVSFMEMVTDSRWFWKLVKTKLNSEWFSNIYKTELPPLIRVLDFQPDDGNILYLNFNGRMASYDIWSKTLTIHPCRSLHYNKNPFQLVLPLCPSKLPKL